MPIIEKYVGTVEKFIGDEIMAIFGAPEAHENAPERALRTALELLNALAAFNAEYNTNMGMHIEVNTEVVIAGGIGIAGLQQYGVQGDTVNLAKQLVNASKRGEIFVAPDTHRLTNPLFDFDPLEPIQVRDRVELVQTYQVQRAKPSTFRLGLRGILGVETRMIGRDVEQSFCMTCRTAPLLGGRPL